MLAGIQTFAKTDGHATVENVNTKGDTAEEATAVQNVIAQKPDAVILMPNDGAARRDAGREAAGCRIPVLAVHTQVGTGAFDQPDRTCLRS